VSERWRRLLAERFAQHGRGLDEHYRQLERRRPLNPAELRRWAANIEARIARLERIIEGAGR